MTASEAGPKHVARASYVATGELPSRGSPTDRALGERHRHAGAGATGKPVLKIHISMNCAGYVLLLQ